MDTIIIIVKTEKPYNQLYLNRLKTSEYIASKIIHQI